MNKNEEKREKASKNQKKCEKSVKKRWR